MCLPDLTGSGKNPKDAASVRSSHPIPAACGIYYFEIKVISKGRDGYILLKYTIASYMYIKIATLLTEAVCIHNSISR